MLTNDIVSFEQLGPGHCSFKKSERGLSVCSGLTVPIFKIFNNLLVFESCKKRPFLKKSSVGLTCSSGLMTFGVQGAQWVNCWPADVGVTRSFARGRSLFSCKQDSVVAFHYHPPIVLLV